MSIGIVAGIVGMISWFALACIKENEQSVKDHEKALKAQGKYVKELENALLECNMCKCGNEHREGAKFCAVCGGNV